MRILLSLNIAILFLGFFATATARAQDWVAYVDSGNNIWFQAPKDGIVNQIENNSILSTFYDGTSITITKSDVNIDSKKMVKNDRPRTRPGGTANVYETKDAFVRRIEESLHDEKYVTVYAGLKNAYFVIAVKGRKESPVIDRFLNSIRFKGGNPFPTLNESITAFNKLPNSPETEKWLKNNHQGNEKPRFEKINNFLPLGLHLLTRDLIIIRKPRPGYTDEARTRDVQGTFKANVEFLKTGIIGSVVVDTAATHGLGGQIARAIKRIKFIPAQANGVNVDVIRTIEYSFTIY